ncbi:UDP-4-amino-4,6-dideoxy-N-acetyl-beta-L-altrosamine transaminase [Paenibacillus dendritiformis]|uniref:UDP-4-amino-4, 6-dideoxy-N-acetyl-beta-L-altrosamine transaminase n=1 Tax=Paenibacillus dendritiformis TaxID=130049 RepID=UPI00365BA80D
MGDIKERNQRFIPYGQQWIDEDDIEAVVQTLRSPFITQGPAITDFEASIADYVGAKFAVAFSNGTAALHAACFAAEIGPGDEVITTPITFLASSNCVLYQGGTPVFADIDNHTYNIHPDEIERKITSRTKAIIPVDFSGQPVAIDRIMDIAHRHGLIVIHDAAHSLGAEYKGKKVGSWADMTMFSFHPVKHITTGEGGVITTSNEALYRKLMLFRNHGMTRNAEEWTRNDGPWYYEMHELGYNYRMTDMQAALGLSQLRKLDKFVMRRREIASMYNEAFKELQGIVIPEQYDGTASSWHLYVLRWLPEYFTAGRREIFEALRQEGIGVNVHYIPVYKQPYYQKLGYDMVLCPYAEAYYQTAMSIPIFPKMSDGDGAQVISAVKKVYEQFVK